MAYKNIASLIRENKTVFIIMAIVLFLIELEIFAVAAMKSGRKTWLQVLDNNGNVIHETDGKNLSDFNKYYFEKTFGPLDQYEKRLVIRETPFPFRAWLTAAVGIPIGVILLFAFMVKAYVSLFYGDRKQEAGTGLPGAATNSDFERLVRTVSSFNVFTIGFLILLGMFMYWVLPNMVTYITKVSLDTVIRFKWVFIAVGIALAALFIWVIYLRYLLARRNIDRQAELEKVRLQLEYKRQSGEPIQIGHYDGEEEEPPLVSWTPADAEAEDQGGGEKPASPEAAKSEAPQSGNAEAESAAEDANADDPAAAREKASKPASISDPPPHGPMASENS